MLEEKLSLYFAHLAVHTDFSAHDWLKILGMIIETEKDDLPRQRLRHLGLFVFESVEEELRKLPPLKEPPLDRMLKEDFIDEMGFSDTVKTYLQKYVTLLFHLFDSDADENMITLFANYVLFYWISIREIFHVLGSE